MIGAVMGALVVGLLTTFSVVMLAAVIYGQAEIDTPGIDYSLPPIQTLITMLDVLAPLVAITGIVAMFIIVSKLAGGFGRA